MSQAQQTEDLIAELRKYSPHDPGNWPCQAAAGEIERLQARVLELEGQINRAAETERAAILLRVKNRAVAGALLVDDFRKIVADRGTPQWGSA